MKRKLNFNENLSVRKSVRKFEYLKTKETVRKIEENNKSERACARKRKYLNSEQKAKGK